MNEIVSVLKPKASPFKLLRVGVNRDGAYLLPNDLEGIAACFSPGVNNFKDFEDELLEKHNIASHMCDFSSDVDKFRTPMMPGQTFKKKWLDVDGGSDSVSLESWVNELEPDNDKDLILQMDIEGAEYRNLINTPEYILKRFRIIVIELHSLSVIKSRGKNNSLLAGVLALLDRHFVCVHAHPNNCCGDFVLPGSNVNVPNVHELTFLRRDRWEGVSVNDCFPPLLPHPLDVDFNVSRNPPLFLNENWLDSGVRPDESYIKILSAQVNYYSSKLNKIEREDSNNESNVVSDLYALLHYVSGFLPDINASPSKKELVDLAEDKEFTLSSKYGSTPSNGRVSCQDPFFFHTGTGRNQYITIDLGVQSQLFELVLKNRTDTCLDRARYLFYCVHELPAPDLTQGFPVSVDRYFLTKAGHVCRTNLRGIKSRYLTIFSPDETALHLSEVRVLGVIGS